MIVIHRPALMLAALLAATCTANVSARPARTHKPAHPVTSAPAAAATSTSSEAPRSRDDAERAAHDFNNWLDSVEQSGQISGMAAVVVKDDKVLLERGVGYADASTQKPVTVDSVFR